MDLPETPKMFLALFEKLEEQKPKDRSDLDRRYAITITELEKVYAYYCQYIWQP